MSAVAHLRSQVGHLASPIWWLGTPSWSIYPDLTAGDAVRHWAECRSGPSPFASAPIASPVVARRPHLFAHGPLRGEQSSGRLVAGFAEAVAAPEADHDPPGTWGENAFWAPPLHHLRLNDPPSGQPCPSAAHVFAVIEPFGFTLECHRPPPRVMLDDAPYDGADQRHHSAAALRWWSDAASQVRLLRAGQARPRCP